MGIRMGPGISQSPDDVVLLAVIEWDLPIVPDYAIRKLRVRRRDLSMNGNSTSAASRCCCSARDVLACLQSSAVPNEQVNDGWTELCLAVYDDTKQEYVDQDSVDDDCDLIARFGARVRIRVSRPKHATDDSITPSQPVLAIAGRFYPFNSGITVDDQWISIQETPDSQEAGTGVMVWDGAVLLARYLEKARQQVTGKRVLELGAGCGVVGISAAILGAEQVLLTDLPYVLPLLQSNVNSNRHGSNRSSLTTSMQCCECDWYKKQLNRRILEFDAQVILLADCVWVEDLVEPLFATLKSLLAAGSNVEHVLLSYQRRGKGAHEAFWKALHAVFSSVESIDTVATVGLEKPIVLHIFSCRP